MLPWIASGWILGIFFGAQLALPGSPLLLGFVILGAWQLALHADVARASSWKVVLAALALACGLSVHHSTDPPCRSSTPRELSAEVERVRYRPDDVAVRFRDQRGTAIEARLEIGQAPPPRSLVHLHAELRPRTVLDNPSPHPALLPKRSLGCWAKLRTDTPVVLHAAEWRTRLHSARQRVRAHFEQALTPESSAVARALVLGDGGALPYERRRTVAAVGLAHLFAVSGLHIALVSGTIVAALAFALRGVALSFDARRLAAAFGAPLALLHAAFAGGAPSAWRAATTAAITWTLVASGRRPLAVPVAAAVALLLSGPDPTMALRPAFLLSIVSTSAILSAPRARGSWRRLRSASIVSARTLIATAPMVWWWFGGVPLIGWLANLVVLPFGSWVVIPLAHGVAASSWLPELEPLGAALEWSVAALLFVCDRLSTLAFSRELPPLDVPQGLIVVGASVALLRLTSWRARAWTILAAASLWLAADAALVSREQPRGALRVTFVDVGQGDAALVDLPDGRLVMIDTGQGGRHPAPREVRRLLMARRRHHIDVVVLTHAHPDHAGGLDALLDRFDIDEVWLSGQGLVEAPGGSLELSVNRALRLGTRVRFAPELCESAREFGQARIEVLWPCPRYDAGLDLNDNSLVAEVRLADVRFLFTGDIETAAEHRLVESGRLRRADVLKVAHHGSRTSTAGAFLDQARPSWAVISSGAGNRYGHPAPRVLRRLREAGARIWRTDLGGGLILRTDGARLWAEP